MNNREENWIFIFRTKTEKGNENSKATFGEDSETS